jgi:hypothetical protein
MCTDKELERYAFNKHDLQKRRWPNETAANRTDEPRLAPLTAGKTTPPKNL